MLNRFEIDALRGALQRRNYTEPGAFVFLLPAQSRRGTSRCPRSVSNSRGIPFPHKPSLLLVEPGIQFGGWYCCSTSRYLGRSSHNFCNMAALPADTGGLAPPWGLPTEGRVDMWVARRASVRPLPIRTTVRGGEGAP